MAEAATLESIERMCWRLSGWQVEQRSVDALLTAIQACVAQSGGRPLHDPVEGRTAALPALDPRETHRVCRVCRKRQDIAEFYKDAHGPYGRRRECRSCCNERKRNAKRVKRAAELAGEAA